MSSIGTIPAGSVKIEILPMREALGQAAASSAAARLKELARERNELAVIFATGESQLATLQSLTGTPGVPWERITGFHMDEYLGIAEDHPASFRRYLRENLVKRAAFRNFYFIDGGEAGAAET